MQAIRDIQIEFLKERAKKQRITTEVHDAIYDFREFLLDKCLTKEILI